MDDDRRTVTERQLEAMWEEVRLYLPEHMRNDPKVAEDLGWLFGRGFGWLVIAVLKKLSR